MPRTIQFVPLGNSLSSSTLWPILTHFTSWSWPDHHFATSYIEIPSAKQRGPFVVAMRPRQATGANGTCCSRKVGVTCNFSKSTLTTKAFCLTNNWLSLSVCCFVKTVNTKLLFHASSKFPTSLFVCLIDVSGRNGASRLDSSCLQTVHTARRVKSSGPRVALHCTACNDCCLVVAVEGKTQVDLSFMYSCLDL